MGCFRCEGKAIKAGLTVVGFWVFLSLLKPCMKTVVIKKMSDAASASVYDVFLSGCAISYDDYTKTIGYDFTHVPQCADPVCDVFNEGHRTVTRKRSNVSCENVRDCVTVLVKTKHRIDNVQVFIKSLHTFYPGVPVIIADEIDTHFNSTSIPQDWLKLTNNSIIYFQVHSGMGYGRQMALQLATLPYILVADDDFIFTKQTNLMKLISVLSSTTVDIVAGAVNDHFLFDGIFRVMESRSTLYQPHLVFYPGIFYEVVPCHHKCHVGDIVKNFFLADRKAVLKAGGWDSSRLYYEHEDFFLQMRKSRLLVAHCGDVIINHTAPDRKLAKVRKQHFQEWSDSLKIKWGIADYYYCVAQDYNRLDGCDRSMDFA